MRLQYMYTADRMIAKDEVALLFDTPSETTLNF